MSHLVNSDPQLEKLVLKDTLIPTRVPVDLIYPFLQIMIAHGILECMAFIFLHMVLLYLMFYFIFYFVLVFKALEFSNFSNSK